MKWFKHYSDASSDEFIADLEDEFGLVGYARWWKLLEVVASQMDESGKCYAEYSWKKWGKFLKTNQNILKTFLKHCENNSKTFLTEDGNKLRIKIPKLLEIRDNHTKNLQVTNKPLTSKNKKKNKIIEVEEDKEKDKEKEEPLVVESASWFEEDWNNYPKGGNKQRAKACYLKTIKTEEDRELFWSKTREYLETVDNPTYYKNGDTWFCNWSSHESKAVVDKPKEKKSIVRHNLDLLKSMNQGAGENDRKRVHAGNGDNVSIRTSGEDGSGNDRDLERFFN